MKPLRVRVKVPFDELLAAASRIKAGRAPGPDPIPPGVFEVAVTVIPSDFLRILTATGAVVPEESKLVLILKPGKPEGDVGSNRPICLLDCIGKLYGRMIFKRLLDDLERVEVISVFQDAEWIGTSIGESRKAYVASVALDVKNAFNCHRLPSRESDNRE
ncbi:hypothetical protein JTB14_020651 [Gonioctena quinquepunctata]|nr:hypothetical protein JTB14_020651 [Gonioctena quinquepunctata]